MRLASTKSQPGDGGEESLCVHRGIASTNFGVLGALLMEPSLAGPGNTALLLCIFSQAES